MYEPKFNLNKRDDERWRALLTRHCLELPAKPGGKVKLNPKYPPLSKAENAEFERLSRKRSRKIDSHPKIQESIRHQRKHMRKVQRLANKIEVLIKQLRRKALRAKKKKRK